MTRIKETNKFKGFIKAFSAVVLVGMFVTLLTFGIILEPTFRIAGFARLDAAKLGNLKNSVTFLDTSGDEIASSVVEDSAFGVSDPNVNKHTKDAFISTEDKRFYSHGGVDYVRIAGAAYNNLKHMSYREGGSTITQQLVKNTHLTSQKTINRKVQEIRIAKELERSFSKDEILSMYLASVYFGNGIYGISAAAKAYFDKDAMSITIDEGATLAAIINSPAKFCPINAYDACMERRNLVLKRMLNNKKLTLEEYNTAINTKTQIVSSNSLLNQYFSNASHSAAAALGVGVWEIRSKNYKICTYFDEEISDIIQKSYDDTDYPSKTDVDFCGIVLDNSSAAVVGFYGTGRKNYLGYKRSPASTIKPLLCYAPAIESRSVYPISPILDEKMSFGGYSPRNYCDKYQGWISVEDSLSSSSNIAAVKLMDSSGIEYCKGIGKKMGLTFGATDNNLALALGGMESGLTLQQIASAYQVFSSGGIFQECGYIKSIHGEDGRLIFADKRQKNRAISEETAYLVSSMLQKCAKSGTAKQLRELKNVYAKTGTSGTKDGNTDAYCISFNNDYTVAVWLGAKSGFMPNNISGGTLAARLNKLILQRTLKAKHAENHPIPAPDGIIELEVDADSLKTQSVALANDATPKIKRLPALFDKRNTPKQTSLAYFNKYLLNKDKTVFD